MTGTFRSGRLCTRASGLACVAVLALLPLTACAAGYQAETSRERTTLTSVGGAVGDLTLRNVFFVGPTASGGNLPLYMSVFNGGGSDDTLVSVTSSSAGGGSVPTPAGITAGSSTSYVCGSGAQVPALTGLKAQVRVGQTVSVQLTFAKAGAVTLAVPVEPSYLYGPSPAETPAADASPPICTVPSAAASSSESASASATASP